VDKVAVKGRVMPADDDHAIRDTHREWDRLALTRNGEYIGNNAYVDGAIILAEAYWRTISMDTEYVGKENDNDNLPLDRKDYQRASIKYAKTGIRMIHHFHKDHTDDQDDDRPKPITTAGTWNQYMVDEPDPGKRGLVRRSTPMTLEQEDKLKGINVSVQTATTGRVFFITEQGYMGLGPAHVEIGDDVAVLAGGHTPFILRPTQEKEIDRDYGVQQCYKLIGDCYVHGLMDGEAVEGIDDVEDLSQIFLE